MKLFSFPRINDLQTNNDYKKLLAGSAITIFGYWFSQIAFFSLIVEKSSNPKFIAIYYLVLFVPKIFSSLIWKYFNGLDIKKIITATQLFGALITVLQMLTINHYHLNYFFVLSFAKGFIDAFIYLYYDSFTIDRISGEDNVNKANSMILLVRYGSVTFFPLVGGIIAQYWGNHFAITVDALTFIVAGIFFYTMQTNVRIDSDLHAKKVRLPDAKTPRKVVSHVVTVFLNNFAYSIFNFLLPIMILLHLNLSKSTYGYIIGWIGILAIFVNNFFNIKLYDKNLMHRNTAIIVGSTFCNGIFLYLAFTSHDSLNFVVYLSLATFLSFISIGFLKTNIFNTDWSEKKKIPSLYNGCEWSGLVAGFLVCSLYGDQFTFKQFSSTIVILMSIGPVLMLFNMKSAFQDA